MSATSSKRRWPVPVEASTDAAAGISPLDLAAVAFVRLLRRRGMDVALHSAMTFVECLAETGMADRSSVYWAARATLIHRPEDRELFDLTFGEFWQRQVNGLEIPAAAQPALVALDDGSEDAHEAPAEDGTEPALVVRFSRLETLRDKDFAACTPEELAELHQALSRLRLGGALRRSRRLRPTRRPTGRPDLRRTVQAALRTAGEPIQRRYRAPIDRPRRLVLLVDVSGSMEPYARALVRFAHAAIIGRRSVEAFTLGTRLSRVTRELTWHDPDGALAAAAAAVADWSGGTRLGDDLQAFNDRWGTAGTARGADVVILSDGWDRGDPELLATEMARLHRAAHRIIWVNPLKGAPGYEPLARGMAAALPHVDRFIEGHALASLEHLVDVLDDGDRGSRFNARQDTQRMRQ